MPCCCVPHCSNSADKGWRLFRVPREPERRRRWCAEIRRDNWQPTSSSYVCSAHFEESCYEQRRADNWKKLRPDAVPTLFPFRDFNAGKKGAGVAAPAARDVKKIIKKIFSDPDGPENIVSTPDIAPYVFDGFADTALDATGKSDTSGFTTNGSPSTLERLHVHHQSDDPREETAKASEADLTVVPD